MLAKRTALQEEAAEAMQRARLWLEQAAKRRKRKKRKRRMPRTSSRSLRGRARRRQRQWHACNAGFPGDVPFRAVFPSVDARHHGWYEPQGLLQGGAEADSHGLCCSSRPWRFTQLQLHRSFILPSWRRVADYGDRRPCCAGRAGFHPGRGAEVFSHGPDCCRTTEFPQFVDTVDDVPVVQSYWFSRAGVEETFVLPLQLVENFDGHQHPCLGAEADPHGFHFLKTIETPQLQFLDPVIDVPVVQVYMFRFSLS